MAKWMHVTAIAVLKIARWSMLTTCRYEPTEMEGTHDLEQTHLLNTRIPFWS